MGDWLQQSLHPLQPHNPDGGMDSLSETEQNKTKQLSICIYFKCESQYTPDTVYFSLGFKKQNH